MRNGQDGSRPMIAGRIERRAKAKRPRPHARKGAAAEMTMRTGRCGGSAKGTKSQDVCGSGAAGSMGILPRVIQDMFKPYLALPLKHSGPRMFLEFARTR